MLHLRFLITMLFMVAMGIASIEIPVSGTHTKFTLDNRSPLSLAGSLKSGDLILDNIDLDEGSFTFIWIINPFQPCRNLLVI